MDLSIILSAIFTFIIFLLLQIIVFRIIDGKKLIAWLIYLYVLTVILQIILFIFTRDILFQRINIFEAFILSFLIYSSLAYIYMTGVFGISITSVRIHILNLIDKKGDKGCGYSQILKVYNREKIVGTRLERLKGSKILRVVEGRYKLVNRFSPFLLNIYYSFLLRKIYLNSNSNYKK